MKKSINYILLNSLCFLFISNNGLAQSLKHTIYYSALTYQATNKNALIDNGLNTIYIKHFLPNNLRYELEYKHILFGVERYYSQNIQSSIGASDMITYLNINSFSSYAGYRLSITKHLSSSFAGGISYYDSYKESLYINYPNDIDGTACYKANNFTPMVSTSLSYNINSRISLGINMRFAPMISDYSTYSNWYKCSDEANGERLHIFNAQFMIGYLFWGKN